MILVKFDSFSYSLTYILATLLPHFFYILSRAMGKNVLFLIATVLSCQTVLPGGRGRVPDSLSGKGYAYLAAAAHKYRDQKARAAAYTRAWLAKAQDEGNWQQLTFAYRAAMYGTAKKTKLRYADTILGIARKSGDNALMGGAYLTKGIIHYEGKQLAQALDNYLTADHYLSRSGDTYGLHKVKYSIAHTKYYLGFYDEAIALLTECLRYFEAENDRAYLNTVHSLGLCYGKVGNYERCSDYNRLGLAESARLGNGEMELYFRHSEAVNCYFKKEYARSMALLNRVLPRLEAKGDFANAAVADFYLARIYWDLGKRQKALPFLLKVDRAYTKHGYTRPDLRENFELLITYYAGLGDKRRQLFYIDRLLAVDRLLDHDYRYLSRRIHREYDTRKLLMAKEVIERSMKIRGRLFYLAIVVLSGVIIFLVYRHCRNKKVYRQKFEQLMQSGAPQKRHVVQHASDESLEISPAVVQAILKGLDRFEQKKKYLEKDMGLIRIAAYIGTNPKYASKVIYRHRNKKVIEYISDLKVDHVIALLKDEKKYRNYTNKALAEEVGFGSTQNFTRAFRNRTGISPTYFIQELNRPQTPSDK